MDVKRIGIVGTGFIAYGLFLALEKQKGLRVTRVLTRRNTDTVHNYPQQALLTNSVNEFIEHVDLVVECTGDVIYGTDVINKVIDALIPVVTVNSELQVTTGSYFAKKGFITEAEGDQPGCLAALKENALAMGFKPLVYGNIKGFLNHKPTREEMIYWSKRNGLSLNMVTSFTDGTDVQIEQAMVANGLGAGIAVDGLLGFACEDVNTGGKMLADEAKHLNHPISDYIISPKSQSPAGVFIIAEHDEEQSSALQYFKMGKGPYYTLLQNYHLCHLEITKTIRRVFNGGSVLLNNSINPLISVGAIAKHDFAPGDKINKGIGSFDVRGRAIKIEDNLGHIPIGLLENAVVTNHIEQGQQIGFSDVEIPESLALQAWLETEKSFKSHFPDLP